MVSTVTTTVSTIAAGVQSPALAAVGILLLLGLLVTKELAQSTDSLVSSRLARAVNIGILPLLFVFALIVLSKVQAVLQ